MNKAFMSAPLKKLFHNGLNKLSVCSLFKKNFTFGICDYTAVITYKKVILKRIFFKYRLWQRRLWIKSQVRFTVLKEEQNKFCISVSVINANRVFGWETPPGGEKEAPRPPPFQFRPPKGTYGSLWKLSLLFRCLETATAV